MNITNASPDGITAVIAERRRDLAQAMKEHEGAVGTWRAAVTGHEVDRQRNTLHGMEHMLNMLIGADKSAPIIAAAKAEAGQ